MPDYDKMCPLSDAVPAPARAQRTTANRYGLNRLEVSVQHGGEIRGQSILIPGKTTKEVARAVYLEAKRSNITVAIRAFPDGVRVYRIKKDEDKKQQKK